LLPATVRSRRKLARTGQALISAVFLEGPQRRWQRRTATSRSRTWPAQRPQGIYFVAETKGTVHLEELTPADMGRSPDDSIVD
jgi:hypothetical protein